MAMTFTSLVTDMKTFLGMSGTSDTAVVAKIGESINAALLMIDDYRVWRYQLNTASFALTASTASYDLSSKVTGLGKVLAIYTLSPNQRRVQEKDGFYYVKNLAGQAEPVDTPSIYWYEGGDKTIKFWPTPTINYTVYVYYSRHHGYVDSLSTIFFPEKYKLLLLYIARQFYKGDIESLTAILDQDKFLSTLWQMMVDDQGTKDTSYSLDQKPTGWNLTIQETLI